MEWAFDYMQREGDGGQASGAGIATRRAARSICGCPRGRSSSCSRPMTPSAARGHHRGRLLAAPARARHRPRHRLHRRGGARGDRGGGAAGGGPARRRRAGGDLGRPPVGRLARGAAGARAGRRATRARMSRTLLAALPRDAAIVTVTDAYPEALSWLGGVLRPSRARAGRGALRPVGLALRALRPLRPRRECHPGGGRGHQRPAGAVSVLAEVSSAVSRSSIRHARQAQRRAGIHLQPAAVWV